MFGNSGVEAPRNSLELEVDTALSSTPTTVVEDIPVRRNKQPHLHFFPSFFFFPSLYGLLKCLKTISPSLRQLFFLLIDWDSTSPIATKVLGEGLLVGDKQLSRIEDTQSRRSPHGS